MRSPAVEAVLEADLAEAAGHDPPEAAGGAAQEAAALAGDGGLILSPARSPDLFHPATMCKHLWNHKL